MLKVVTLLQLFDMPKKTKKQEQKTRRGELGEKRKHILCITAI